ncbi:MAG: hydratase [Acidobacteria bacterium]|nr:hydratase [Acidobacteriota bacterium]
MQQTQIETAAQTIWQHWNNATQMESLPKDCRPQDRAEGYAIQAVLAQLVGQEVVGWKIAATSIAGQQHIGVDGPIAGRLFANRVLAGGATLSLDGIAMRLAEAEFTFRFRDALPKRAEPYSVEEVLAAVDTLHPAIEIPDSRYHEVARAGAPQLIADDACASWFLLGAATTADWRSLDLAAHRVQAYRHDALVAEGSGANVLGDPRIALTWIANELSRYDDGLQAGQFVTTGTCVVPMPIAPGDHLRVDFGVIGVIDVSFT